MSSLQLVFRCWNELLLEAFDLFLVHFQGSLQCVFGLGFDYSCPCVTHVGDWAFVDGIDVFSEHLDEFWAAEGDAVEGFGFDVVADEKFELV